MLQWRGLCIWGVRTRWHTESDGDFYCPGCGGDRGYRRRTGDRRLTVLGVPLLGRGSAGTVAECTSCRARYGLEVLDRPTSTRFSAMLRDAVHTVALAVLAAGGGRSPSARQAAARTLREAGFADCADAQLAVMLSVAADGAGPDAGDGAPGAAGATAALHEALHPLAPHLAPHGRAAVLLQGAWIALADGPYLPAEREVLAVVGRCLRMTETETAGLLDKAEQTRS